MHRDGSGYGGFTTPASPCELVRFEQTGASSHRVVEACASAHGASQGQMVSPSEIESPTGYRVACQDGWESAAASRPWRPVRLVRASSKIGSR